MVYFGKFVHTETGKLVMSILLGFGLASLFRSVCKGKDCIVFHAPPLEKIQDKVYKSGDKCYKFQAIASKCDKSKKIVDFE
jgi:hypothetical protein